MNKKKKEEQGSDIKRETPNLLFLDRNASAGCGEIYRSIARTRFCRQAFTAFGIIFSNIF